MARKYSQMDNIPNTYIIIFEIIPGMYVLLVGRGVARVRHMGPRSQPQRLCPLKFHKLALGAATLSRNCRTLKIGLAMPLLVEYNYQPYDHGSTGLGLLGSFQTSRIIYAY